MALTLNRTDKNNSVNLQKNDGMQIQLHKIINVAKCYEIIRSVRWVDGVICSKCASIDVVKNGKDPVDKEIQHYKCKSCGIYFDDLSDTIFSGSHFGIHQWISVLYLMNLNVSNLQISNELEISEDSVAKMCAIIREGVVKKSDCRRSLIYNLVEQLKLTSSDRRCGYVVAGQKGQPKSKKANRKPRRRRLKSDRRSGKKRARSSGR